MRDIHPSLLAEVLELTADGTLRWKVRSARHFTTQSYDVETAARAALAKAVQS